MDVSDADSMSATLMMSQSSSYVLASMMNDGNDDSSCSYSSNFVFQIKLIHDLSIYIYIYIYINEERRPTCYSAMESEP